MSAASERRELARGGLLGFVGSATSAAMGLVVLVVLARTLGDAASGVVFQAIAAFTIALGVARFGMDSAAIWLLPRLLEDDRARLRPASGFLLAVAATAGLVCTGVLLAGAYLAEAARPGDPVAAAIRSIAWLLPVASVMLTALSATRALGGVATYVLVGNIGLTTLRPVAIAVAVGLGGGAVAATVAWALPFAPAAIIAVAVLGLRLRRLQAQRLPIGAGTAPLGRSIPGRTLRYGLPRVVSSSLEQLLIWLAVLLVGGIAGPAAAGVYAAASRFVAAGMLIDTALRVVVAPMFTRLLHRGDRTGLETLYRTATVWLVLFSAPLYLLLAIFAPVALSVLGDSFADGEPVVIALCAGALMTFLAGNVHSILLMSGRSGLAAVNKAVAVGVNVALIALLVPLWGITGAAAAWAVACAVDAALATLQVRTVLHLRVSPRAGLYPLLVATISVGLPALAARLLLGPTVFALVTGAAVGATVFLLWCRADRARLHLLALSPETLPAPPTRHRPTAATAPTAPRGGTHA